MRGIARKEEWNKSHSHGAREIVDSRSSLATRSVINNARICFNSREYAPIPLDKVQRAVHTVWSMSLCGKTRTFDYISTSKKQRDGTKRAFITL